MFRAEDGRNRSLLILNMTELSLALTLIDRPTQIKRETKSNICPL